jgi:hypothetical protein
MLSRVLQGARRQQRESQRDVDIDPVGALVGLEKGSGQKGVRDGPLVRRAALAVEVDGELGIFPAVGAEELASYFFDRHRNNEP